MGGALVRPGRAVAVSLLALVALGGCGSETPSEDSEPRGVRLTPVRTLVHGNDSGALAFSPDGLTLATGGGMIGAEGTVKLWSTSSWTETASFVAFFRSVYSLAFTPDGTRLAGSGFDQDAGVKLWDVPSARLVWSRSRSTPRSLAVSPDGRRLAVCSMDDRRIEIVGLDDGVLVQTFVAHEASLLSLAFSGDGRFLVSGSGDHLVKLWNVPAFSEEAAFSGHGAAVWSVAASPDGRYAASGTLDGTVRLWRTSDHAELAVDPHPGWVWSVAFSSDGELLASGGDAGVYLFRVSDGLEFVAQAEAGVTASDVQFSPDGRFLAASLADNIEATAGTIRIWRVDR